MGVYIFFKRGKPPIGDLDIRVDKQVVLGIDPGEGTVVSSREPVVAVELYYPYLREILSDPFYGSVFRCIVCYYDLVVCRSPGAMANGFYQPGKKSFQISFPVPVQYDYRCLRNTDRKLTKNPWNIRRISSEERFHDRYPLKMSFFLTLSLSTTCVDM